VIAGLSNAKRHNHYIPSVDDYIRDPDPEIFYPDPVYEDF